MHQLQHIVSDLDLEDGKTSHCIGVPEPRYIMSGNNNNKSLDDTRSPTKGKKENIIS